MNKRKSIIIMLIVFLAIGFATVSTTLVLNGILAIGENKDDFNIIFTKAKLNGVNRNDFISGDKKHINFISNELKNLDDTTTLTYEVTNTSRNYDADVSVTCTAGTTDLITFEYTPHQMEVLAGETKTGSFTASMFKLVDEPMEVPIECTLTATAKTREELGEEYVAPFSKSGVMMAYPSSSTADRKHWSYRSNVTKAVFEDKLIPHETTEDLTFDVSDLQDKSVMAYLVPNGGSLTTNKDVSNKDLENTTAYTLYIQGDTGVIANSNSSNLFYCFNNLLEIENMKYLDTSNTTNMSDMFYYCNNLTTLDVSDFNTNNATNMRSMFGYCQKLLSIDVRNFNTSNVTDMWNMFFQCTSLTSLDVSNFDTSNVTEMPGMFNGCYNITSLNLRNFDTSNVTKMNFMFYRCEKATFIDVSNFNTSNVTDMGDMFSYCKSVKNLDISKFNTRNVKNLANLFSGCEKLVSLDVSKFDTENVTNMSHMFYNCRNITALDVSSFKTLKVTDMSSMFASCEKITNLDLSNFDTSKVTNMSQMFSRCRSITTLDLSTFNTSKVTNMSSMFNWCENITSLDIRNFDFNNLIKESSKSNIFSYVNSEATVYIKDAATQEWILALGEVNQPSWTADNFVIVGA